MATIKTTSQKKYKNLSRKDLEKRCAFLESKLAKTEAELKKATNNYETALVFEERKRNRINVLEKALLALSSALIEEGIYKEIVSLANELIAKEKAEKEVA